MTEEEAKTKICCGPMQAEHGKTHVVNCTSSACMAWRWETKVDVWLIVKVRVVSSTEGFCGLAGKS